MAEGKEIEIYKPIDLQSRLKEELEMLEKYFWPEKFRMDKTKLCFERTVKLKCNRTYKLRVYVSRDYPDILPELVVCNSPEPMPSGPEWSGNHKTHTWPRKDGFLRICHWHWACWKRENMIYQVFNKGEEWLEAYEKYRENRELPLHLEQMQLTEEEKMKENIHARALFHAMLRETLSQRFPITDNERRIAQQMIMGSTIQRINQVPIIPGQLEEMFGMRCAISESQDSRITHDEIRNTQKRILEPAMQATNHEPTIICIAAPCRLTYEITQCQRANPGCTDDVSFTQTYGQILITVKPVPPQSCKK